MSDQKKKRGRPPANNHLRDFYVAQVVAGIVDYGVSRDAAARIAKTLLAGDNDAFRRQFVSYNILEGTWKGEDRTIMVPKFVDAKDDEDFELRVVKLGALIYAWWQSRWPPAPEFGLPNKPIHLSESSIRRAYAEFQERISEDSHIDCVSCGHRNYHRPARGEYFRYGDACRQCGDSTNS